MRLGVFFAKGAAPFFENANRKATVDYRSGMQQINYQAQKAANSSVHENKLEAISNMIETENQNLERGNRALKILVTDESGKVVYKTNRHKKSKSICIIRFVMQHHLRLTIQNGQDIFENTRKEFIAFSPITIENKNLYMFVSGIPDGVVMYDTQEGPFPFLIGVLVFIFSFFYITKER